MKKTLVLHGQEFESASNRTPQYLEFHRTFKREFTKALTEIGCEQIQISKPNHFDVSGFFMYKNQIWYFSLSDLRWSKKDLLIRTASHFKDYTGGSNQFVKFDSELIDNIKNKINR